MFAAMHMLITSLPPGIKAAVRDITKAYRTIPICHEQWPSLVVRILDDDLFAVDTRCCFRLASRAGIHGIISDAGADLMQAKGICPIAKWVDNHIFFQLPHYQIDSYNQFRKDTRQIIIDQGSEKHERGRTWFTGSTLPNGQIEEWHKDMRFPIQNFPHRDNNQSHTCTMEDINDASMPLSIPWQLSKDLPFTSSNNFIGFYWNLHTKTVTLPDRKHIKYLKGILRWNTS